MINEREKLDKILDFNIISGNQNNNVAIEFLSLANWNIPQAVNLYLDSVFNSNNNNINNNVMINPYNNFENFKYITEYSFESNGILNKVTSIFKSTFLKNNEECCNDFIGKIKCLVKTGDVFTNLLKANKGVIILYNKDTLAKLNQQLDIINNDNQNNYLNAVIIYPIIDNSIEGKNLIEFLHINRFPCYLFCRYKTNNIFYITDKMEGIFYLSTFKNTLFPNLVQTNINNVNNTNVQKSYNNKNSINTNKFQNNSAFKGNEVNNKKYNYSNINISNNEINVNNNLPKKENNNNFKFQDEIKSSSKSNLNNVSNNNYKSEFSLFNNSNNNENKSESKQKINNISENKNNNFNVKKSEIKKAEPEPKPKKKEYIPDYRDYQFDNENDIDLIKYQIPTFTNLNDINMPMSDSAIRRIQDDEMRELERMEEERQRKERQEKERKRKEEEEKRKKEEIEKEDKEIFSQLIPPEPDDNNPDKCIIVFRLPDGEKNIQRKFLKTDKIAVLYDYIRSLGKEIYSEEQYNNFSIIQTFPFKNFENKLNNTLEEEGLFPNSMLQIKESN